MKQYLDFMREALGSDELCERIARNSYRHPNFMKIPLSFDPGINTRLHIWKSGDSNLHTHRWDMKVTILSGSYLVSFFEEPSNDGLSVNKFYCSNGVSGIYQIKPMGATTIELKRSMIVSAGDGYTMKAGEIHCVAHPYGVVSLVECGPDRFDHSFIYSKKWRPDNEPDLEDCSVEDIRVAFRVAIK